jgi:hypothetical protein
VGEAGGPGASGRLAEDPYRTLRLRPGATRGEVKKAFRRLALMVRAACVRNSSSSNHFSSPRPFHTLSALTFTVYRESN